MRFLRKNKIKKTILVISDVHLGAGPVVKGRRNCLEDFNFDKELVEFLDYYSSGDYLKREMELIILGDFFDFLAVPFVEHFDDEYWSETAAIDKLNMIIDAHPEVMDALEHFLTRKNVKLVYILGNHDAELLFPKTQELFLSKFPEEIRDRIELMVECGEYCPIKNVMVKHGHEYEVPHTFDRNLIKDNDGERYFIPPWGSYYVTRVLNRFKEQRNYINRIKPLKHLIISGLIFDTLFTLRFVFATSYYFIMVRVLHLITNKKQGFKDIFKEILRELELFGQYDDYAQETLESDEDIDVLIFGHSHRPSYDMFADGTVLINTGSWIKTTHIDLNNIKSGINLTYAQIDVEDNDESHYEATLNEWNGKQDMPYVQHL